MLLTVRYNVPILDVGGRVITSIAYGIEHIMSPLKGDLASMRAAFRRCQPAGWSRQPGK